MAEIKYERSVAAREALGWAWPTPHLLPCLVKGCWNLGALQDGTCTDCEKELEASNQKGLYLTWKKGQDEKAGGFPVQLLNQVAPRWDKTTKTGEQCKIVAWVEPGVPPSVFGKGKGKHKGIGPLPPFPGYEERKEAKRPRIMGF